MFNHEVSGFSSCVCPHYINFFNIMVLTKSHPHASWCISQMSYSPMNEVPHESPCVVSGDVLMRKLDDIGNSIKVLVTCLLVVDSDN